MLIGFWVTTKCNLDCRYCYEGHNKNNDFMSKETVDLSIQFISELLNKNNDNKLHVQFHGGEPLLNYPLIKYIVDRIIELSKKKKILVKFGITTNGLLLNEERINYLFTYIKDDFSISIDGEKETHDYNRKFYDGTGSYDKVIKNVVELIIDKEKISARMTYNSDTVSKIYSNVLHLLKLGFTRIISTPDYYDKKWNEENMNVLLTQMLMLKRYYNSLGNKKERISISLLEQNFYKKGKCSGGIHNIHILPNGDIYPCSYAVGQKELVLDNLYSTKSSFDQNVKNLINLNSYDNIDCLGCTNYSCCICTRCKIINKTLEGDYHKPSSIICAFENLKYQFLNAN